MRIDGLSVDRQQALAAVAAAGERTADVIGATGDPGGRTRGLDWTLGQTAAHLLVAYGRVRQLGPILRGQLIAWGRKPWAAPRLNSFIRNP